MFPFYFFSRYIYRKRNVLQRCSTPEGRGVHRSAGLWGRCIHGCPVRTCVRPRGQLLPEGHSEYKHPRTCIIKGRYGSRLSRGRSSNSDVYLSVLGLLQVCTSCSSRSGWCEADVVKRGMYIVASSEAGRLPRASPGCTLSTIKRLTPLPLSRFPWGARGLV